jgi:hypothetical protein
MSVLVVGVLFLAVLFAGPLGWNGVPSYARDGGSLFGVPGVRGNGHVISENRDVKSFNVVHIGYPGTVLIRQGPSESLTIDAEDNVVAAISTQVVNGVLEIDNVRDHRVYINPTKPVKITITVKDLNEVSFDAAGDLTVQGLKTSDFRAVLNGAGSMNLNDLKLASLQAILSGAGSLHATGAADSLEVRLDGLGSFDGTSLQAQTATVNVNGLGSADVWVSNQLTANINGLGFVNYYGNAQVSKTVNGLGNIHYMGGK